MPLHNLRLPAPMTVIPAQAGVRAARNAPIVVIPA